MTFLAREPVLFPGTMRQNLARFPNTAMQHAPPFSKRLLAATTVDAGGRGFSQGQRQLVGLARSMLKRSAVVILDETTASIGMETAIRIQQVLREEMRESTAITIAHRLEAVRNADYVVLGKGKLVRAGNAKDMLAEGTGFSGLLG